MEPIFVRGFSGRGRGSSIFYINCWKSPTNSIMKTSFLLAFGLALVLAADAADAARDGPGRNLLAKCTENEDIEYYGTKYFIKLYDSTRQNGSQTCCDVCKKTKVRDRGL